MENRYTELIHQTFNFPQEGFSVADDELYFNDIPLMEIIKQYGTPLRITYLPKIGQQIQKAKRLFNVAMAKVNYKGKYIYCYCTKSSHFSFVLDEVLKNDVHLETSSAYDIQIIKEQFKKKKLSKDISFNGANVDGKYLSAGESIAEIEGDKDMGALIGIRKNFRDRSNLEIARLQAQTSQSAVSGKGQ